MASGDSLVVFGALNVELPASNPAGLDTRNGHPVLDFDASTNESAVFSAIMPEHYADGGLTIDIIFAMSSATTGDVDWDVQIERVTGQDTDSDGFAAANSIDNTTVNGTSGVSATATVTFTNGADMDSVVAGDEFRINITRDATSDTAAGDAELRKVHVKET